jgi:hypothetical protein
VLLYFVPARVDGTWQTAQGALTLKQNYQLVSGTLGTASIENGRVKGEMLSFTAGGTAYTARLVGETLAGTARTASGEAAWRATRAAK